MNIHASPLTKIKDNDTLEHRVKIYAFSKEIVKELKKQADKEDSPQVASEMIFTNSLKILMENNDLKGQQKFALMMLLKANEPDIKKQIQGIVLDIKKDEELILTEKMFNLASDIYNETKETEICHPNIFFEQLEKVKVKEIIEDQLHQIYNKIFGKQEEK